MWRLIALACLPGLAQADSLVATRAIRAQAIVMAEDVVLVAADIPGAATDPLQVVGQEAQVVIYPGRPVRLADLGAPALIDRNQVVKLYFLSGGLSIATEGRALDRGGSGDLIKVMNLASRTTVVGLVGADGVVRVGAVSQGNP